MTYCFITNVWSYVFFFLLAFDSIIGREGGKLENRGMLQMRLIVIDVDHCKEIDFIKLNLSTTALKLAQFQSS